MKELEQIRAVLVKLLEERGDFRKDTNRVIRGASLLAFIAVQATAPECTEHSDEEKALICLSAHANLFNA